MAPLEPPAKSIEPGSNLTSYEQAGADQHKPLFHLPGF
jgi:hypothetical protein